mmetsp:Transcript_14848/g.23108  ORF Transcript_14848/g.23108 Transcript_14848/m.23108 type:complete len:93 (+) Transcript_14848:141-419(+)
MYSDFYTNAVDAKGEPVHLTLRYTNLKRRLEDVVSSKDQWIEKVMAEDEKIKNEISHPDAVREYCSWWLKFLKEIEGGSSSPSNDRKTDKSG